MADSELTRVYHQIRNELDSFLSELKKLSVPNYPSKTGNEIIKMLAEKLDKYEETLSKIMGDIEYEDENIVEQSHQKLITKIHNPLVKQDVKFLNWLSKAQTKMVPWSFVHCVEELFHQIIPDHSMLVYCENQYNYGICWSKSKTLAPYPYYILSLPGLHRTNILWHTLVGHEIFHPRCPDFINKHNQEVLANITTEITKNYNKFTTNEDSKNLFSESEKKERIDEITNVTHTAWCRAMEELLSDMACVEIFGPAAILAMKAYSACSPKNDIPEPDNNFYPSWQYRFEIVWDNFIEDKLCKLDHMYSEINNDDIVRCFKKEMLEIKCLVEKKEGEHLIDKHKLAKIAYKEIKTLISDAVNFVKNNTTNILKWYDEKPLSQIPALVGRLENGIPPNEMITEVNEAKVTYNTKPATIPAILISGWIYETYWQERFGPDEKVMKYKTLSRLILKACEDIETIEKIQQCQS